ncbi:MAG: DUF885 domain-containing protein [Rhodoluna sp.]|jgi:uncharacterized protein (DUF885 family)
MSREQSKLDVLAEEWVKKLVELSPDFATYAGFKVGEDRLEDTSPEAGAEYNRLEKEMLAKVEATEVADEVDNVTKMAMTSTLKLSNEIYEAGLWKRDLNPIASTAQGIRDIFDISPTATVENWENLAKRMRAVDGAVEGYIACLREGIKANDTPAVRQIKIAIEQAEQLLTPDGFFRKFAANAKPTEGELPDSLKKELIEAAEAATAGYGKMASFFKEELLPAGNSEDAIGRERYALLSARFLGKRVDLDETYEWGREELERVIAEQKKVANEIKAGATVEEAIKVLDEDPKRKLRGTDELQRWMQKLSDAAIEKLSGTHFDIAPELKNLECMIAPTQHGGIYYTSPTDDFSRPGRMWWSVPVGVTEFNTWRETTTVYHEGVPGHHLQIGQKVYNKKDLNSWRRLASWSSGHGEGWALYAERLMQELGFLDDPGDRLGMLDGQRMRAARVVLDLGVHLGKQNLEGTGKWDFDYALAFMRKNVNMSDQFVNFEVHRYFGWPGQAPSYKIGQRIWEQIRDEYKLRQGENFNIKEFHMKALNLGSIGLDTLEKALLG